MRNGPFEVAAACSAGRTSGVEARRVKQFLSLPANGQAVGQSLKLQVSLSNFDTNLIFTVLPRLTRRLDLPQRMDLQS